MMIIFAGNCARSSTDRASDYGSEGLGFESLRAHQEFIQIKKVKRKDRDNSDECWCHKNNVNSIETLSRLDIYG